MLRSKVLGVATGDRSPYDSDNDHEHSRSGGTQGPCNSRRSSRFGRSHESESGDDVARWPSFSDATMAYLEKIEASPASARVLARAEDVSLAPATASGTKVENHPDFGISDSLDDSGRSCGLSRPCSSDSFLFEQKECTAYSAFALSTSSTPGTADGDRITCQIAATVLGEEGQDHQLPPSFHLGDDEDNDEEPDDESYVTTTAATTRIPTTSTATLKPIIAPVIPNFILQFWDERDEDLADAIHVGWKQDAHIGLSANEILTWGSPVEEGRVRQRQVADLRTYHASDSNHRHAGLLENLPLTLVICRIAGPFARSAFVCLWLVPAIFHSFGVLCFHLFGRLCRGRRARRGSPVGAGRLSRWARPHR